jgi:signal transduction histidine kinase
VVGEHAEARGAARAGLHRLAARMHGRARRLLNMRQRAAAIGGAFSLRSVPGRGTALEVVLRP